MGNAMKTAIVAAAGLALMAATAGVSRAAQKAKVAALPAEQCASLAKDVSRLVGFPVKAANGNAQGHAFSNITGDSCLLSGSATGLTQKTDVLFKLPTGLPGWNADPSYDADGPMSTSVTYRKGDAWVSLSLAVDPPAGTCENVIIADCRIPMRRWVWTLDGMGFVSKTAPAF